MFTTFKGFLKSFVVPFVFLIIAACSIITLLKTYEIKKQIRQDILKLSELANQNISRLSEFVLNDQKEKFVELLKVYSIYDQNGPMKFIRHGRANDGGYVTPESALKAAEVLMGYGIANDNSFEEQFSDVYNKPSYGFDCSIDNVASKNKLFTLIRECIGTDSFIYYAGTSPKKLSSFSQQINNLQLNGKKVFIKMDIEGAEYEVFDDILLNHSSNITGIVLELHFFPNIFDISKAIKLLSNLRKDFLLVHVHGNNVGVGAFTTRNSLGNIPQVIEVTLIHKSLVKNYHISENQMHPLAIDMPNVSSREDMKFEILINH